MRGAKDNVAVVCSEKCERFFKNRSVIYIRKREAQEAEQAKVNSTQAKELQLLIDTNGIA